MTLPSTYSDPIGKRLPSAEERRAADQLRTLIARAQSDGAPLRLANGASGASAEVVLGPALTELLLEVLRPISAGNAVTLVPISQKLTTQQAADLLNVSRPHLIKLLEAGAIQYTLTGRHRRIEAKDVFAYKAERDSQRDEALDEIGRIDGADI